MRILNRHYNKPTKPTNQPRYRTLIYFQKLVQLGSYQHGGDFAKHFTIIHEGLHVHVVFYLEDIKSSVRCPVHAVSLVAQRRPTLTPP